MLYSYEPFHIALRCMQCSRSSHRRSESSSAACPLLLLSCLERERERERKRERGERKRERGEAYDAIFMDEVFVWQLFKIRRLGFKGPIIGLTVLGKDQYIIT